MDPARIAARRARLAAGPAGGPRGRTRRPYALGGHPRHRGVVGGAWLWLGRGSGYVIATVWSLKGLLYTPALSAAAVAQFVWGATDDLTQLARWLPIGAMCLVATWLLLRAPLL